MVNIHIKCAQTYPLWLVNLLSMVTRVRETDPWREIQLTRIQVSVARLKLRLRQNRVKPTHGGTYQWVREKVMENHTLLLYPLPIAQ